MNASRPFIAAFAALALSACAAIQPERAMGRDLDDASASLEIKSAMLRAEGYAMDGVDVEVTQGVALLSGSVPRETDRVMAECLAWSSLAVRSVANEVQLSGPGRVRDRARDVWISQRIRGGLLRSRAVRSVNYKVEVSSGAVYLLGVSRTREELETAADIASRIPGVESVVTYVRVLGEDQFLTARGDRRAAICGGEAIPALEPPEDVRAAPVTPPHTG